ncbi:MAG: glycine/D-amino acid oxidase-like deaminating enzyme [Hyphomicrobiaceae bacterium]|jgi:glycine/D-amino acid oxidase-like deaminating enzyme
MHDVLVVGGGIHGLCSAFALRRRGRDVVVLDRFEEGHDRGGSHGAARITRSSYHERKFVRLAQRARRDGWPLLSSVLGRQFVHPTPGVFFGPPEGLFAEFLAATLGSGVQVEQIDVAAAARAFPLLRFDDGDAVMVDHTAGVLAASDAMTGLREWLGQNGVEIVHGEAAMRLAADAAEITVETSSATRRARAVVVASGAWLGELLPEWSVPLRAIRQQVGYVQVTAPSEAMQVGTFPVWCRIGKTAADFVYGLPEFGRPGLKLAHHRTLGPADDANALPNPIDVGSLEELARLRLAAPFEAVLSSEHCMYAVAPNEELHVARSEMDPRIVAVAACSGHGFKFGPVIGEDVADLLAPR